MNESLRREQTELMESEEAGEGLQLLRQNRLTDDALNFHFPPLDVRLMVKNVTPSRFRCNNVSLFCPASLQHVMSQIGLYRTDESSLS